MSILVCGGAGYVGSHCLQELKRQGVDCIVLDNLSRGHREAVGDTPLLVGDLGDEVFLEEVFSSHPIEGVMHFAASSQVGESVQKPLDYYENNLGCTIKLLQAMERHGVGSIVFSSSAAVYGEPEVTPIPEESPCRPTNPYGETKLAMERLMHWCERAYGIRSVSLRYFNAAGADPEGFLGEDHNPETHLIPLVLQAALGVRDSVTIFGRDYPTPDGSCIRDYIHVQDLAQAHLLALRRLLSGGESGIFNLGSQNGMSVCQIIETAKQVTGVDFPVREGVRRAGDPAVLIASSEKARRELGWSPVCSDPETILSTAWRWHQAHPHGYGR